MSEFPFIEYLSQGQQAGSRYCLAAPRHAPLGTAGSQLGRMVGESMEFMDHREYQPGDDLRRLDWAAFARSDKMTVKLYRQEVCPHLDVVLDGSKSMALDGSSKLQAAVGLAAALAAAAGNAGYSHRAHLAADGCKPLINGAEEPLAWRGLSFDSTRNPHEELLAAPPPWRPRGIRVLISDLLWLGQPLDLLTAMAAKASALYVLQVLAREDAEPSAQGNVRLIDSESGLAQEVHVDATAKARYRDNFRRHQQNWMLAARQVGALMVPLIAEELCDRWDFLPLVQSEILKV